MINLLLSKFLKNFLTSLIIFYSRKLIFYIDAFFKDTSNVADVVECGGCHSVLRKAILRKMNRTTYCPHCGFELEPVKDELAEPNIEVMSAFEVPNER